MLTCEFDNLTAYGTYMDQMATDAEAQSYSHRIRGAEAPFVYESTAVLGEIDLERPDAKRGRGRVLDARFGRPRPGRWHDTLAFAREAFDLCDKHGAVGRRLFELNHAGVHSGWLCAVIEYNSMTEFGAAGDGWMADDAARQLTETTRTDSPFEPLSAGLFTEVAIF